MLALVKFGFFTRELVWDETFFLPYQKKGIIKKITFRKFGSSGEGAHGLWKVPGSSPNVYTKKKDYLSKKGSPLEINISFIKVKKNFLIRFSLAPFGIPESTKKRK